LLFNYSAFLFSDRCFIWTIIYWKRTHIVPQKCHRGSRRRWKFSFFCISEELVVLKYVCYLKGHWCLSLFIISCCLSSESHVLQNLLLLLHPEIQDIQEGQIHLDSERENDKLLCLAKSGLWYVLINSFCYTVMHIHHVLPAADFKI
jgi:hypothetical protein